MLTLNVQLQFRNIEAKDYAEAVDNAYDFLMNSTNLAMIHVAKSIGIDGKEAFMKSARTAKEANGSYTVTIP